VPSVRQLPISDERIRLGVEERGSIDSLQPPHKDVLAAVSCTGTTKRPRIEWRRDVVAAAAGDRGVHSRQGYVSDSILYHRKVSWTIGLGETHVWLAPTNLPPELLESAATLLDDEERRRVASFRFEADRRLSLIARAARRALLGRYTGRDPRALRFVEGPQGKPSLTTGELEFNVSHSGGHVAVAISGGGAVGVDIEAVRKTSDIIHLAARFFSAHEAESVRTAPDEERPTRFFAYWTAKESVIKAVGGGLSLDLRSFQTDPRLGQATPVQNLGGDSRLGGWNVFALPSGIEAVHLALALRGTEMPRVREFDSALLA